MIETTTRDPGVNPLTSPQKLEHCSETMQKEGGADAQGAATVDEFVGVISRRARLNRFRQLKQRSRLERERNRHRERIIRELHSEQPQKLRRSDDSQDSDLFVETVRRTDTVMKNLQQTVSGEGFRASAEFVARVGIR